MTDAFRVRARRIAQESLQRGDVTGWFDTLYQTAKGNEQAIPWADMETNHHLVEWFEQHQPQTAGQRALVIGCGLGDDAEYLVSKGFEVVAFDISATATEWCRRRFPNSQVQYMTADLFQLPAAWAGAFDFVLEIYTVQALPHEVRAQAIRRVANCVALGGTLLVICRGREERDDPGNMPWPLTLAEIELFQRAGLHLLQFEDYFDPREPLTRRFRALFQR